MATLQLSAPFRVADQLVNELVGIACFGLEGVQQRGGSGLAVIIFTSYLHPAGIAPVARATHLRHRGDSAARQQLIALGRGDRMLRFQLREVLEQSSQFPFGGFELAARHIDFAVEKGADLKKRCFARHAQSRRVGSNCPLQRPDLGGKLLLSLYNRFFPCDLDLGRVQGSEQLRRRQSLERLPFLVVGEWASGGTSERMGTFSRLDDVHVALAALLLAEKRSLDAKRWSRADAHGPGKEQAAQAAHYLSGRREQAFAYSEGGPAKRISRSALSALRAHSWPGNVRELEHVILRAHLLSSGECIDLADLLKCSPTLMPAKLSKAPDPNWLREQKVLAVREVERRYVEWALNLSNGNISEAARLCNMERATLSRMAKKYRQ